MSSERFPGKVLHPVKGKPMLQYLIDRLNTCKSLEEFIVATSDDSSDNPIETFCLEQRVRCVRGPKDNVAARFKLVLDQFPLDGFVRVNGDSPLLDGALIEKAILLYQKGTYELVTNVYPRSFPKGQSVEVLQTEVFLKAYEEMKSEEEKEHVTKHFYNSKGKYRVVNFSSDIDYSSVQLSVDTKEDMEVFASLIEAMEKDPKSYSWEEIVELKKRVT